MKRFISKHGGLYLALFTSLCGIVQSQYAQASSELIKNGSFYTLQDWQSTSVSIRQNATGSSNCQHNGSDNSQCPQTSNKNLACLQSNSQSGTYANTYLRQSLSSLLPNTRYKLSFKALRPITATTANTNPATLLSSIAGTSGWPTPATTYANWSTPAPAVKFNSNNTLLDNSSAYGSGFYTLAQAQTMEFVTPSTIPAGQPTTINFAYTLPANNNEGICITDVSLQQIQTLNVNAAKVAVNSYGYLNNAAKQATLSNLPSTATMWQLVSEFENTTIIRKQAALPTLTPDDDSGDRLGIADFSDYTGTSIDPRFRIRVVDSVPYCALGADDGKGCLIPTPASTIPFASNGKLYHSVVRCPLSFPGAFFDSANCYVATPPLQAQNRLYTTAISITPHCGAENVLLMDRGSMVQTVLLQRHQRAQVLLYTMATSITLRLLPIAQRIHHSTVYSV